jgi:hypothetical protein
MPITDRAIDQAFSDLKRSCGGVRNDYFGLVYLEQASRGVGSADSIGGKAGRLSLRVRRSRVLPGPPQADRLRSAAEVV